jgi:hypothetical protein
MATSNYLKAKGQVPDRYIRTIADECQISEQQARFAVALAAGVTVARATDAAGMSRNDRAYLLLSDPRIQKARRLALQAQIEKDANLAYNVILEIATSDENAPTVRFQAASKILEMAGHGGGRQGQGADDNAGRKDLADMSVDELRAFVDAGAVRVAELRQARTVNGVAVRVDDSQADEDRCAPGCAHLLGNDDPLA